MAGKIRVMHFEIRDAALEARINWLRQFRESLASLAGNTRRAGSLALGEPGSNPREDSTWIGST
jgi:hypothetical protein